MLADHANWVIDARTVGVSYTLAIRMLIKLAQKTERKNKDVSIVNIKLLLEFIYNIKIRFVSRKKRIRGLIRFGSTCAGDIVYVELP